jgi:cytochrome c-type biogenesis protein CcmH/NrfG
VITYAHDGQRAQVELALHACEQGDYATGIKLLTALLTRERVTVPPPPSGSGM